MMLLSPPAGEPGGQPVSRLLARGRYVEARAMAESGYRRTLAAAGPAAPATAGALDLWVKSRLADGDRTPDLLSLAQGALELNESLFGPEDPRIAASLANLAMAAWEIRGDSVVALDRMRRAHELRSRHLGESDPRTLTTAVSLAILLRCAGKFAEAESLAGRAGRLAETRLGPESLVLSKLLSARGRALWQLDRMEEARPLLERSVRIQETLLGVHPDFALALNQLAVLEWSEGNYVEARALYERQLEVQRQTLRPDHPDLGTTWLNMGLLHWRIGDLQGARELFDRSYALPAHRESPEHTGRGYQNYARLALEMGDLAGAQELLEKLRTVRERLLPPEDPLVVRAYWDLGALHREMGQLDQARRDLLTALERSAVVHGGRHTRDAEILRDLGLLEERAGDHHAARRPLERALGIMEDALGRAHPGTVRLLGDLARIDLRLGKGSRALELSLEAAGSHRRHMTRLARSFPESEALSAEQDRLSALQTAYLVLARAAPPGPGTAARVWDETAKGRALVLDAIAARHRAALDNEGGAAAALLADLEAARRRLARLFLRGPGDSPPEEYSRRLREAEQEKERLERRLAEAGPPPAAEAAMEETVWPEARGALPAGSSLVAFVEFADSTAGAPAGSVTLLPDEGSSRFYMALLLVQSQVEPAVVPLGPAQDIEKAVDRWRREASSRPRSHADVERYREAGRRLRRLVWDPVAEHLGPSVDVFVVPEAALHLVSFAALPDDDEGYLVERIRFHYLSSERDIVPPGLPAAGGKGLLVLGGADFDAEPGGETTALSPAGRKKEGATRKAVFRGIRSACGDSRSMRFPPLPGSEEEAMEVAEIFRSADSGSPEPVTVLTGGEAQEGALKQAVPGHRILHLATHSFALGESCASALPRPGGRAAAAGGARRVRATIENPLLLSGIVLTSANRRDQAGPDQEDGLLTAEEAASLDLRGVEWAVLAGCGTGLGFVQTGEGVLGLRRAFFVAGAGTLIMSLWPVEDHAARQWFRLLYEARLAGASTPLAMQRASLELLARRRAAGTTTHPLDWGAYVAAGRWR
ncbi:MAG TPA: CHAT domain-containing tetratricopeptide repeat protein [Candidatus Polarisedimenticolia bacterium]|nr:CHAT domain-containing tetratricopeptide repeat protein [Candidatus Polarisedimenticolia bacterium]